MSKCTELELLIALDYKLCRRDYLIEIIINLVANIRDVDYERYNAEKYNLFRGQLFRTWTNLSRIRSRGGTGSCGPDSPALLLLQTLVGECLIILNHGLYNIGDGLPREPADFFPNLIGYSPPGLNPVARSLQIHSMQKSIRDLKAQLPLFDGCQGGVPFPPAFRRPVGDGSASGARFGRRARRSRSRPHRS